MNNDKLDSIKELLIILNNNLEKTNEKIDKLELKVDKLDKSVNEDLYNECKKMGSHIDFVETVYDNVKHPLGYICKKVQYLTGNSEETYSLTDLSQNIVL
jgi:hypothetical protein